MPPARVSFLKKLQYELILRFQPRKNLLYTQFYRFPNQSRVLTERVIPFFRPDGSGSAGEPLQILLFGSSDGAEPYSLASLLRNRFPELKFHIRAFDIVPAVIAKAQQRVYPKADVYRSPFVQEVFVQETFDFDGTDYRIKEHIASCVSFEVGSVTDDALIAKLGTADMVFAQNFLFHLKPSLARVAFINLTKLLKPRSALFVDGMDTKMRIELTKKFDLQPVDHLVEEVHNDAFIDRGENWSNRYWGREPFTRDHKEWLRKFGTVFLKGA